MRLEKIVNGEMDELRAAYLFPLPQLSQATLHAIVRSFPVVDDTKLVEKEQIERVGNG